MPIEKSEVNNKEPLNSISYVHQFIVFSYWVKFIQTNFDIVKTKDHFLNYS